MNSKTTYNINLDTKFGTSQIIDIPGMVAACKQKWFNQTLCQVNDSVVRLGILEGEFHWHKHDKEDEFFLVLEGKLLIDLESETVELGPQQAYTVPHGVLHCTRAPEKTVVLMIEESTVKPTGD